MDWTNLFGKKEEAPYVPVVELPEEYIPAMYISGMNTPVCMQFLINRERFTIGSGADCDGIVDTPALGLSRQHAVIEYENGTYTLSDCRSTNGTYLNGKWLLPETKTVIRAGDQIRFGMAVFSVDEISQEEKKDE